MTTYDTESDVIESSVNFSLVDPTLVSGRSHRLHNDSAATITVSSTGATPFSVGGVNSATITLAPGIAMNIYSNGTRWISAGGSTGRQIFAGTGVTDGSGNVTFTFPVPFAVTPVVQGQAGPSGTTDLIELRLTAVSATACTFNMRRAPAVTILGISVITFPIPASGVTVQCLATTPGATP